ncbi:MAG: pyridoxal phosphate-dependent aminotransferase [Firmicutes bacterium]|nr:pyridoxal phosphate-dependent aminotransferase [Bacillota bacterium]
MQLADRARNINPSPTLTIDAKAKKMIANGVNVINFGAGEPDFDTPVNIKKAAVAAVNEGMTKYTPVAGTEALRKAIAEKFARDNGLEYAAGQIVVSAGAKHSLYNAFQVLCQEGDEVILPAPYWVSYLEQVKLAGAKPVILPAGLENNFKITPEELEQAVTPRTKVFVINSPSNPTGAVYTRGELAALGNILEKSGIAIISDEIYEKLIYDGVEHVSIASLTPALKEQTVVINGVSKSYAMTGWRIGYAAAAAPVAKAMADLQGHSTSNPTSIAQAAAIEALAGEQQAVHEMVAQFVRRRDYMVERLNAMPGVVCNRPGGAFYVFPEIRQLLGKWCDGKKIENATDLAGVMLEKAHVAIVPGIAFGDDSCFRLSYATSMENIKVGLDRIENLLGTM